MKFYPSHSIKPFIQKIQSLPSSLAPIHMIISKLMLSYLINLIKISSTFWCHMANAVVTCHNSSYVIVIRSAKGVNISMCTMNQCQSALGQWVQFRSPWGMHRGIIQEVSPTGALIRMPRQYAPMTMISDARHPQTDADKLDVALAQWGYGPYPGPRYGPRYGPGYNRWAGGWFVWWFAFAAILALAFLW